MSTWKKAKEWAEKDRERDWRDEWKYGQIVRGVGLGNGVTIDFGPAATEKQKEILTDCIQSLSKWASVVEDLLDNPPDKDERKLLKRLKKINK